ncbi:MAG TPA: ABC transporter ATP-binding protein [Candidatus Binataceae bacterium]|jgi:ABC-type sugar transport system ATPase subunit|nr:ABC transporter ATP-binding protein [Candidatus Binataceae bacterium]
MSELEIRQLSRHFKSGGGIGDVSLSVEAGELFVLVGPSGCGKSTLLRLIAGLEYPDSGEIRIGGEAAGDRRDLIAMVFQNHALYPHMSAFDNIGFPLRLRRIPKPEIERRVAEAAALAALQIDLARRPAELSGGERQRVALARALIRQPRVILMDEPLSSLDAQLRGRLRVELKDFQRRTGRTIIYVTHDQLEALTLGDRIAVMRAGAVEQIGTPTEVYQRPANLFVATFIGQPPMNILRCRLPQATGSTPQTTEPPSTPPALEIGDKLALAMPFGLSGEVLLGIRPEDLSYNSNSESVAFEASFTRVEFIGASFLAYATVAGQEITALLDQPVEAGRTRWLYAPRRALHFFDPVSQRRLG